MKNQNKWRYLILGALLFSMFHTPGISQAQEAEPSTAVACNNLVLNGDMEESHSWQLSSGGIASTYVDGNSFAGQQALMVGPPVDSALERNVQSTAWQAVRIPASSPSTLSFWYRPETDRNPGSDRQYIGLINTDGSVVDLFVNELANKDAWQYFSIDVTRYAGRTLWVYFGVENDGWGGSSRLFVDDVQLCSDVEGDADETPITVPTDIDIPTEVDLPGAADIVGWEQLGFEETLLQGPFGSATYRFGIPSDWSLKSGAELSLDIQLFNPLTTEASRSSGNHPVGTLYASLNGIQLAPIFLSGDGTQSFVLPIPDEALISYRSDGRHDLIVGLESEQPCESEFQVSALVLPSTQLLLPHSTQAPSTDLSLLPRPFFQDSFVEDTAVLVVPEEPSPADMQSALAIATGFGRMTKGELLLSLVPINLLTEEMQQENHIIMVGSPDDFAEWEALSLPAQVRNGRIQSQEAQTDDGIVQMVVSPWNSAKVVMVVSGNTETGLIKAGQAVSSGILRVGTFPNLAIVADIQVPSLPVQVDQVEETFSTLGYGTRELDDRGINYANYHFTVPAGYILGNDASFELIYNHSALLNYDQSGVLIDINGEQIGSVRFDETSTSVSRAIFNIPRHAIHAGDNELLVKAELAPLDNCLNPTFEGLWLSLSPDSKLTLPINPAESQARTDFNLDNYPTPFEYDVTLGHLTMILPSDDVTAWQTAVQLAVDLGDEVDPPYAALGVAFADAVPEDVLEQDHLILVGQPSQLELINELSDVMPAPFIAGSNLADENNLRVQYRMPQDSLVGYLEFFPSPWNRERAVLTVLGSGAEGVQWAGNALTTPRLNGRLEGNLAIIQGEQVISDLEQVLDPVTVSTTAETAVANSSSTVVAEESAEGTAVVPATLPAVSVQQPTWLLDAIWVVSGLMVGVVALAFAGFLISRRSVGRQL